MRLENLTPAHVRRAVEIYLGHAWPDGPGRHVKQAVEDLREAPSLEELLSRFERDGGGDDGRRMKRYTLRLGNERYPFMKFVVQEHLVGEEFFFSVDTHDRLDIREDNPDYEGWLELKEYNRALRDRIDAAWDSADLPTHNDLRALVERLAKVEKGGEKRARLLLVDDERAVCIGLAALLKARGYEVEVVHDGGTALERLRRDPVPDLVLLDYEMPGLDGQQVLAELRSDVRLERLPILMATAARIELSDLGRVSGFLRKPYPREVLFRMIARILEGRHDTRGAS